MVHRVFWRMLGGGFCVALSVVSAPAAELGCCFARPVALPPVPYAVVARPQIYIVNQGPVYSGPNLFTVPRLQENIATFTPYPYAVSYAPFVGRDDRPPVMRYRAPLRAYRPLPPRMGPHLPPRGLAPPPPRFGHAPPPLRRPPGPSHLAPPDGPVPHGRPPAPSPRLEPKKPVEQWTQGVPQ